jgi:hypothetical protein
MTPRFELICWGLSLTVRQREGPDLVVVHIVGDESRYCVGLRTGANVLAVATASSLAVDR